MHVVCQHHRAKIGHDIGELSSRSMLVPLSPHNAHLLFSSSGLSSQLCIKIFAGISYYRSGSLFCSILAAENLFLLIFLLFSVLSFVCRLSVRTH